jgi:protease I
MAKPIVLIVAAAGFQAAEYLDTKATLEAGNLAVITASDTEGEAIASDHTTKVKIDFKISDIDAKQYDGIFLIGGPGALEHLNNKTVVKLMHQATKLNIPRGAICIAPRILAQAGLLTGLRATGWNEDHKLADIFSEHNVQLEVDKPVVTDGNVITATGPRAAKQFGQAIVKTVLAYNTGQREF